MFAEATNYIKRQTFNNSENWFKGDEHSYMIERKMAHLCLLQCLLTFQMFSCKSVDAASFLALTCWLNTPLLLWIAAGCESRMLKCLVCIVGSGMKFLNCLHCPTEEFFLPASALGYLTSCAWEEQINLSEWLIFLPWWWISALIS